METKQTFVIISLRRPADYCTLFIFSYSPWKKKRRQTKKKFKKRINDKNSLIPGIFPDDFSASKVCELSKILASFSHEKIGWKECVLSSIFHHWQRNDVWRRETFHIQWTPSKTDTFGTVLTVRLRRKWRHLPPAICMKAFTRQRNGSLLLLLKKYPK